MAIGINELLRWSPDGLATNARTVTNLAGSIAKLEGKVKVVDSTAFFGVAGRSSVIAANKVKDEMTSFCGQLKTAASAMSSAAAKLDAVQNELKVAKAFFSSNAQGFSISDTGVLISPTKPAVDSTDATSVSSGKTWDSQEGIAKQRAARIKELLNEADQLDRALLNALNGGFDVPSEAKTASMMAKMDWAQLASVDQDLITREPTGAEFLGLTINSGAHLLTGLVADTVVNTGKAIWTFLPPVMAYNSINQAAEFIKDPKGTIQKRQAMVQYVIENPRKVFDDLTDAKMAEKDPLRWLGSLAGNVAVGVATGGVLKAAGIGADVAGSATRIGAKATKEAAKESKRIAKLEAEARKLRESQPSHLEQLKRAPLMAKDIEDAAKIGEGPAAKAFHAEKQKFINSLPAGAAAPFATENQQAFIVQHIAPKFDDAVKEVNGTSIVGSKFSIIRPGQVSLDRAKVERYAAAMKKGEWDGKPVVLASFDKEGNLIVQDGHHRLAAAIESGTEFDLRPTIRPPQEAKFAKDWSEVTWNGTSDFLGTNTSKIAEAKAEAEFLKNYREAAQAAILRSNADSEVLQRPVQELISGLTPAHGPGGASTFNPILEELLEPGIQERRAKEIRMHRKPLLADETRLGDPSNPEDDYRLLVGQVMVRQEKPERAFVADQGLWDSVDFYFRDEAKLGSGSTPAAAREEIRTRRPTLFTYDDGTPGEAWHIQKSIDGANKMTKWLNNPEHAEVPNDPANPMNVDRALAKNMLRDFKDAIVGLPADWKTWAVKSKP